MKLDLKQKIEAVIYEFRSNNEQVENSLKAVFQKYFQDAASRRYTDEGLHEVILEEEKIILEARDRMNLLLNQKLKVIIEEGKKVILPSYFKSVDRPTDYSIRLSNAIEFIKLQRDDVTDDELYIILKDFIDDMDTMKIFKGIIERRINADPRRDTFKLADEHFPKTFGKLLKNEQLLDAFTEIDGMVEQMFMHPKADSCEDMIIRNVRYSIPCESYQEMADEDRILELAEGLDSEAVQMIEDPIS